MAVVSHAPAITHANPIAFREVGVSGIMAMRGEIVEEPVERIIEDRIYVAVGKIVRKCKSVLLWALQSFGGKRFCIIHVHQPAQMIPFMGMRLPESYVEEEKVKEFRKIERLEVHKVLNEYLLICRRRGVQAEKLYIESDCIEKGILELISRHGIRKLVMGAAAVKRYSKRMIDVKSKKAISVRLIAPIACHIWFVCKGHLIYTRQAERGNAISASNDTARPSSGLVSADVLPGVTTAEIENESAIGIRPQSKEELCLSLPPSVQDGCIDDILRYQLEQARTEGHKSRREVFEEAMRTAKAEKGAIDAIRKAKTLENLYVEEVKQRKEIEEALAKEKEKLERMKGDRDKVIEELRLSLNQKSSSENQISKFEHIVKELEQKILSALELLQDLKKERGELQNERDAALKEAEDLRKIHGEHTVPSMPQFFSEFSFLEIEKATQNFNPSLKIGEGSYGNIYKGLLRHTQVAIKILKPDSKQGPSEFQQEVDILSKIRHPNLVTLIGTCPEAWALIYEYLPNGSLEDRLSCKDNSPPLPWQTRICIAAELCSVLIFLHSGEPYGIIHGDLKPANILLDANFVTKLGDFGICRLLSRDATSIGDTTHFCRTNPMGTFGYIDPEFVASGELTTKSDVYSYGIILLQLLTGRPAVGITKEVQHALDAGNLKMILDPLGRDWPFEQAEQLVQLAMRCCEMNRRNRPDLASDVWRVLEPMRSSSGGTCTQKHCQLRS